jgi:hypothetical protein
MQGPINPRIREVTIKHQDKRDMVSEHKRDFVNKQSAQNMEVNFLCTLCFHYICFADNFLYAPT